MPRYRHLLIVGALLAAGACSDDSTTSTTTAAGGGGGASTTAAPSESTTSTTAEPDGCATDISVVNADAAGLEGLVDRQLEVVSLLADQGPHPANTVDYDSSLSLAISEVEILADEQFGLGIPIDVPENIGDDDVYFSFSFFNEDEAVAAGQLYIDQLDYDAEQHDGKLNSTVAYYGTERLLPGSVEITITEITDDQVCGTISTITETDLQTFVGIEGTFAAERIQALEG
jgi:hypothetical protein